MTEQRAENSRGRQQVKIGTVVSNKMDKTVVVKVTNTVMHRLCNIIARRLRNRTDKLIEAWGEAFDVNSI